MKVGLDFHGVITDNPEFFARETELLIKAGNEVHIITGQQDAEDFRKEIKSTGVQYTHFYSIVSYHMKKGTTISWDDRGHPWLDSLLWDKSKADYCQENDITLLIDDTARYGLYFDGNFNDKTAFLHYNTFKLIREIFEMGQQIKC